MQYDRRKGQGQEGAGLCRRPLPPHTQLQSQPLLLFRADAVYVTEVYEHCGMCVSTGEGLSPPQPPSSFCSIYSPSLFSCLDLGGEEIWEVRIEFPTGPELKHMESRMRQSAVKAKKAEKRCHCTKEQEEN